MRLSWSTGYGNLGLLMLDFGDPENALPALKKGLSIGRTCYQTNALDARVLNNLRWHYEKLSESCCRLGHHDDAIRYAQSMADLSSTAMHELEVAQAVTKCLAIVEENTDGQPEIEDAARPYVDTAVNLIRKAAASDEINVETIAQETAFDALRKHAQFQALIADETR